MEHVPVVQHELYTEIINADLVAGGLSSRKTARSISAWDDPDFEVDILRSLLTLVKNPQGLLLARARELGKLKIHGPGSGTRGTYDSTVPLRCTVRYRFS